MLKNYQYNCTRLGNIKNLEIKEIEKVKLLKNMVLIQVQAIGLNYVDVLMMKGDYQFKNIAPFVPGIEASGIVIDENCKNKKLVGKKVIISKKGGCFAELIQASLNEIIIIPKSLDCALAAGSYIPTLTSYISLHEIIKLKKDQNILITGASGGIGVALIRYAKGVGANVTSIVSNKLKGKFVKKVGSDKAIYLDSKELNNVSQYKKKYKIDIILDINGLIKTKKILSFLSWRGIYMIIGFMNKNFFKISTNIILIKGLKVYGIRAGEYFRNSNKKNTILKSIIEIIKKDNIKSKHYNLVSFKDLPRYLYKLENRTSLGKNIVITKYYKESKK